MKAIIVGILTLILVGPAAGNDRGWAYDPPIRVLDAHLYRGSD